MAAIPTQLQGIETGDGQTMASGTNAPLIDAGFLDKDTESTKLQAHRTRLAFALEIDQASRTLPISPPTSPTEQSPWNKRRTSFDWKDNWSRDDISPTRSRTRRHSDRRAKADKPVPSVAFRVLDAPRLKDDFYCSVLAYSYTCRTLAVALMHRVYLWTEADGVRYPPLAPARPTNYVSSLAFSSKSGGKSILAVARNSGHVSLWSLFEHKSRFEIPHPWAACTVA